MNALIDLYNKMSETESIFNKYTRIGKKNLGNKFSFISTNTRGILIKKGEKYSGFYSAFEAISRVENIPRDDWSLVEKTKQEKDKQHTVKMRESEFFMVDENRYLLTKRGSVFKRLIADDTIDLNEKKLVTYILLLSGYFSQTPNYIINQTKNIQSSLLKQGYTESNLLDSITTLFKADIESLTTPELFLFDYTYIDSFAFDFDNISFLNIFRTSNETTKEEFKNYIKLSYEKQKDNPSLNFKSKSILLKKYESGGNYIKASLIDNALLIYVTTKLIKMVDISSDFSTFLSVIVDSFNALIPIDKMSINTFIYHDDNIGVFRTIYASIYNIKSDIDAEDLYTAKELAKLKRIDYTDLNGSRENERVVMSLKKIAKTASNYRCEYDSIENCKYFTSKENDENYLEIHHFIPRQFSNDFDYSIEVLENYVALCPNCHRKIHSAVDRERKHLLHILLNNRANDLQNVGLNVTQKNVSDYYKCIMD